MIEPRRDASLADDAGVEPEDPGRDPWESSPELPELRKKEKEKKAVGVSWSAASPGSGIGLVRTPMAMAVRGPLGLGRNAAQIAKLLGERSILGAAFASKMGGSLLLAGLLGAGLAGGAFIGSVVKATSAKAAKGAASAAAASASAASSGAFAPQGEGPQGGLSGGSVSGADGAQASASAASGAGGARASDGTGGAAGAAGSVAGGSGLAQASGMATVSGSADAGPTADAARMAAAAQMRSAMVMGAAPGAKRPPAAGPHGRLSRFPRNNAGGAKGIETNSVTSLLSMGALKWAKLSSLQGKTGAASDEAASRYERNAFDMTRTNGGVLHVAANSGLPSVVPPMGGGLLNDGAQAAPEPGPTQDFTPYQPQIDDAKNLSNAARKNHNTGVAMMLIGALLLSMGAALMGIAPMLGSVLLSTGTMLTAQGLQTLAIANNQANQAKLMGDNIEQDYEQQQQGQIVKDCASLSALGMPCLPKPLQLPKDSIPPATADLSKQIYVEH